MNIYSKSLLSGGKQFSLDPTVRLIPRQHKNPLGSIDTSKSQINFYRTLGEQLSDSTVSNSLNICYTSELYCSRLFWIKNADSSRSLRDSISSYLIGNLYLKFQRDKITHIYLRKLPWGYPKKTNCSLNSSFLLIVYLFCSSSIIYYYFFEDFKKMAFDSLQKL